MATEDHGNGALAAVNKALVLLGEDQPVTELDEASRTPKARKCAVVYAESRKTVLRDHAWGFARRELAVHSVCRGGHGGSFTHAVPKPADAFRIVACHGTDGNIVRYLVQGDMIHARERIARVVYIADVDDLDLWDSGAYHALVLRLCADLAKPITGRMNDVKLHEQRYAEAVDKAKEQDAANDNTGEMAWGTGSYLQDAMLGRHEIPTGMPGSDARDALFAR